VRSNLPPGVTDSMIPGNRPQDEEWDNLIEKLALMVDGEIDESEHFEKKDIPDMLRSLLEEFEEDPDFYKEQGLDIED